MSKSLTLHLSAMVLTLASAFHLIRAISGWEVSIGGWMAPVWVSVVLFIVAGILAFQLWKQAK